MRGRDESVALRSLVAAVEANTESIKNLGANIEVRLNSIETKVDTLIDTLADHIAHHDDQTP